MISSFGIRNTADILKTNEFNLLSIWNGITVKSPKLLNSRITKFAEIVGDYYSTDWHKVGEIFRSDGVARCANEIKGHCLHASKCCNGNDVAGSILCLHAFKTFDEYINLIYNTKTDKFKKLNC